MEIGKLSRWALLMFLSLFLLSGQASAAEEGTVTVDITPNPLTVSVFAPSEVIKNRQFIVSAQIQNHSDGKIDDIVSDLIDMGVDCLNPLDPYAIDYKEYKKKFGDNLSFCGNIDIEFPLSKGRPEDVAKDVKEHMDVLKPGYGYVCSSSHSIVNYIPFENFVAQIDAIHKYGIY